MKNLDSKFVLVLSGGGSRGLYTCGILKALEECGLKKQVCAVYGVSAGALCGAYWLSGWKSEDILNRFLTSQLFSFKNFAFPPKMSILKSSVVESLLKEDVKSDFLELSCPLYVGVTDLWKAEFCLYSEGDLIKPVLASMSIPWIFEAVEYDGKMLVDGGVLCNFPLLQAKEKYENTQIVGVYLGQFQPEQKINHLVDTLLLSYQVSMQAHLLKDLDKVDYLFKRELSVGILDSAEDKIKDIFELGYQDGMQVFQNFRY